MRAATTLCALHYLTCSLSIWVTQTMGYTKKVALPYGGTYLLSLLCGYDLKTDNVTACTSDHAINSHW